MPNLISRLYNFVDDSNAGIPITALRVDSELNQLVNTQNLAVIVAATAPSSPINGELWFDSTNKVLKEYRNSEWVLMGPVHFSATAPATPQTGDIWLDLSGSEAVLKFRNLANSAWIQNIDVNSTGSLNPYLLLPGDFVPSGASTRAGCLLCDGSAVSRTTYSALFSAIGTNYGIGDGSTTFNLPNTPGRSLIGAGTGVSQGTISNANTGNGQLTVTANNSVYTGTPVLYTASSTPIGGLTSNTTYYAIRVSSTLVQLATTLANAVAGTAITLTSGLVGTDTLTVTLTTRSLGDQVGEETHANTIAETPSHTHNSPSGNTGSGGTLNYGNWTPGQDNPATSATGGSGAHNNMPPSLAVNWFIKT